MIKLINYYLVDPLRLSAVQSAPFKALHNLTHGQNLCDQTQRDVKRPGLDVHAGAWA